MVWMHHQKPLASGETTVQKKNTRVAWNKNQKYVLRVVLRKTSSASLHFTQAHGLEKNKRRMLESSSEMSKSNALLRHPKQRLNASPPPILENKPIRSRVSFLVTLLSDVGLRPSPLCLFLPLSFIFFPNTHVCVFWCCWLVIRAMDWTLSPTGHTCKCVGGPYGMEELACLRQHTHRSPSSTLYFLLHACCFFPKIFPFLFWFANTSTTPFNSHLTTTAPHTHTHSHYRQSLLPL